MGSYVDRIKPDSYGITTYLENLQRGQYQIPTFQRDVVWDRDRVKRLWDSIYKFYPLGSILVWRTGIKLQNHREIGGHELKDDRSGSEFHLKDIAHSYGEVEKRVVESGLTDYDAPALRVWSVRN
ncbi:MAG: DUF262 domain-containing protein [Thermodesulfobacteriota bacterium]|nr:DUF262 domain-containing protein [Thermodesulfobacteriota bacterium]